MSICNIFKSHKGHLMKILLSIMILSAPLFGMDQECFSGEGSTVDKEIYNKTQGTYNPGQLGYFDIKKKSSLNSENIKISFDVHNNSGESSSVPSENKKTRMLSYGFSPKRECTFESILDQFTENTDTIQEKNVLKKLTIADFESEYAPHDKVIWKPKNKQFALPVIIEYLNDK